MNAMNRDDKSNALFFFRKLVFTLYHEIGALQPRNHPEIAEKADIKNGFFQGEKQKQSVELYGMIENEEDPAKILAPFEERTRLTLEDLRRAFDEGDWKNKFGGFNFGGPKWVKIADMALEMRRLIEAGDWESASVLTYDIKRLKNNQGYLINQFEWTERR